MGTLLTAFNAVLPLSLVILAGLAFSRLHKINGSWVEILNKYALYIGFPALIIVALMNIKLTEHEIAKLLFINSVNIIVLIFLAFIIAGIFKLGTTSKRTLILILPFTNNAYLGMPVLQNAFGDAIMLYAAIISAVYLFWMFTLALFLLEITGENTVHLQRITVNLLTNPMLIAVGIGFFLAFFEIKLPAFAESTIRMFAGSVTAVVLFSLGIFLGLHKSGTVVEWLTAAMWSGITMLIFPLVLYFIIKNAGMEILQLKATILDAAMPLGLTPYALSTQYKLNISLVARIVVIATILSVLIIPLWMTIIALSS